MARMKNNNAANGISGRVDQFVYKLLPDGTQVVAKVQRNPKKWSKDQDAERQAFRKAQKWASAIIRDPQMKAYYSARAQPGQSAYNAAISDYRRMHKGLGGKLMA
jgi:hypothetical protein